MPLQCVQSRRFELFIRIGLFNVKRPKGRAPCFTRARRLAINKVYIFLALALGEV